MADVPRLRSPLDDEPAVSGAGFRATPVAVASRLVLWGAAAAVPAGAALGVALPLAPCRAARGGDLAALWLGPDEWLLASDSEAAPALAARLAAALRDVPHALVDVTHRQVRLALAGERVADVLAIGVPLDLDPSAFPVGMATRTLFGKAEVVLWRIAPDGFALECWRSFAPYVLGLLREAAREPAPGADEGAAVATARTFAVAMRRASRRRPDPADLLEKPGPTRYMTSAPPDRTDGGGRP